MSPPHNANQGPGQAPDSEPLSSDDARPDRTARRRRSAGTAWRWHQLAYRLAVIEARIEKIEADLAEIKRGER